MPSLLDEFKEYKKTGTLLKSTLPVEPKEEPKTGLLTKAAQVLLPKSLEYKFGITPKPEEKVEAPKVKSLLSEFEDYKKTKEVAPIKEKIVAPTKIPAITEVPESIRHLPESLQKSIMASGVIREPKPGEFVEQPKETIQQEMMRKEKETERYLIEKGKLKDIVTDRYVKDFLIGVSGTTEGMVGAAEWIAPKSIKPFLKEKGDQIQLWQKKMLPDEQTFLDQLVSGAGSAATFFIPGLGVARGASIIAKVSPKLALLFGNIAATALESATEAGSVYRQKMTEEDDESKASWAATKTFIANSVLIGLTNKFGAFSDMTTGFIKRALLSAPMEGIQEYWQEVIQNVNTGRPAFENALTSGAIGLLLGIPMGAIGGLGRLPVQQQKEIIEKEITKDIEVVKKEELIVPKELVDIETGEPIKEGSAQDTYLKQVLKPAEYSARVIEKKLAGEEALRKGPAGRELLAEQLAKEEIEAPKKIAKEKLEGQVSDIVDIVLGRKVAPKVEEVIKPTVKEVEKVAVVSEESEIEKLNIAKTGEKITITAYAGIKDGRDSGFRSPSKDVAQAYADIKGGEVMQKIETLNNPYVASDQNQVLRELGQEDMLKEMREEVGRTGQLRPDNPVVIKSDNLIKTLLSEKGYDSVIYTHEGRRESEYQVFKPTPEAQKGVAIEPEVEKGIIPQELQPLVQEAIPKELQPLAVEARKYKSAEEFRKNLGQPLTDAGKIHGNFNYTLETRKISELEPTYSLQQYEINLQKEYAKEIKRGDYVPPIQIEKDGTILDGNRRLVAYDFAGKKEVPVLVKGEKGDGTITNLTDIYTQAVKEVKEVKPAIPKAVPKEVKPELTELEKLDKEITKQVDKTRKEMGIMADKSMAGARQYKSDMTQGEERIYSYFKLSRAKADMKKMADAGKKYATELLYENDSEFRKLVDERDKLLENNIIASTDEIDVKSMFDEVSKEEAKINEATKQFEEVGEIKEIERISKEEVRGVEKAEEIKAPGGMATIGKFADTEVKLGGMDKIQPVEFPELVELTNDLMGRVPEVSRRLRTALGKFYGIERGRIKLTPALFKKENSGQLAKTLAHEIGHLIDYLPHETLKRGNLLGSLLSLRSFLKNQYGEIEITNKEIRGELKELSKYWRPWDEATATPSYKNYRNSARELYADAVSVLLNSPGTLEEMSPKFYESFFKYLDEKPDVKEAYFNLQEVLSHDRATLVQLRRERVKEMFDQADYKAKELQEIKEKERKIRLKDFWEMFTYGVKSINQPIYNKVKELRKQGVNIPDEQNPEYLLSGRNYLSGRVKGEFKENVQPIMKDLFKNDIDWKTFGEFLFYERIAEGDRSEFANPRGITPKAAEELRESLKQSLGDRYKILEENADKFRGFLKKLATEAYETGMYRQEMFDIIKGDEKYVPFQVLEYMENYIAWKAKPQVGTLKDVNNPANSLLLKAVSTIRAIENQIDRVATFEMLEKNYPNEIKEADLQFTGKAQRPIPSRDSNFEMVTYYKEGKLRGKYVDPYIAASLEKDTIAMNRAVMTILSPLKYLNQKLFRPLFVVYNPGWIPFNFIRDYMRFWKNTPGMTMYRALKLYGKALRPAKVRVFGLEEEAKMKDIEAEKLITKLEKEKVLSVTWNDFLMGQTSEDAQIEATFEKMGLIESEKKIPTIKRVFDKILKYTGIRSIMNGIRKTGELVETLPKVAGYYELEGKMAPNEMRTFIRRNIGSPDFFEKGYLTAATNDIFLFSNAFIQAVTADANIAVDPKTRSGFWWKTAKVTFLPKLIMFLALIGAFGAGIKKMMEDASEYDLTNYIVIPIGRDSDSGKTAYLRLPQDETSRLLGGVLWKGMNGFTNDQSFVKDVSDIASLFGGQLPSLTPAISLPLSAAQFTMGQNPYDSFRGREVLTDQQFKAGGWYATKPFLLWSFQQMGGNVFMKFYAGEQTPTKKSAGEKFLQIPVLSNVIGRFIRISDYGSIEKYREKLGVVQQEQARKSIDENRIINNYIKKVQKEEGTQEELYKDMVVEILGHPPKGSEEKDKAERLKKKFKIAILRGESDPIINSFISAYTNEEKLTLLRVFKKDMAESEFLELKKTLLKYKIVSQEVFNKLKK